MPIAPRPDVNSNNVSSRRSPSPKRETDAMPSEHPVVTREAYDALVRGNGADVNLDVKRLAQIKHHLGQAMQLAKMLRGDYQKRGLSRMQNAVRSLEAPLDRAWSKVPLNIQNK
jgi:hypothetical protein